MKLRLLRLLLSSRLVIKELGRDENFSDSRRKALSKAKSHLSFKNQLRTLVRMTVSLLCVSLIRFHPWSSVVKNLPATAGDTRGMGSLPGSESALEYEMANHSSILAWKIPWTEEPGGLESRGSQRVKQNHTSSGSSFSFLI